MNRFVQSFKKASQTKQFKIFAGTTTITTITVGTVWHFDEELQPTYFKSSRNSIHAVKRCSRTLRTMVRIAYDYKYTWWKYDVNHVDHDSQTSELHKRAGKRLLDLFKLNKGLYIKMGQYMASLNHVLPPELTSQLQVLQDAAPFVPYDVVESVFIEELNHPPEHFFAEFDKKPLAAASLAQVHRAVTHDGQEVAVKIQYPTLRRQFWSDMFAHHMTLKYAEKLFSGFTLVWMHPEISDNLEKELDFINEGQNCEKCGKNFENLDYVTVPKIKWDLTTHRILAMEFINGNKITDTEILTEKKINISKAVEKTIEALSSQIFTYGFVHCDPHPGNIFVRKTNTKLGFEIVLLDHGLYREMEEKTRINYCKVWHYLILHDDEKVKYYTKKLGVDRWDLFAMTVLMRPYSGGVGFQNTISKEQFLEQVEKMKGQIPDMINMMEQMPRELLLVLRNQSYLRFLSKEMGTGLGINRFKVMAKAAVKGEQAISKDFEKKNNKERNVLVSYLSEKKQKFMFDFYLTYYGVSYWLGAQYLKWFVGIDVEKAISDTLQNEI